MAKRKGLEADECYWIAHEPQMRRKRRLDLRSDPPPDLVVEIDVMHSVVNREQIYASLGVPEMWLLSRDRKLAGFRLDAGKWKQIEHSLSVPFLTISDLNSFIARVGVDSYTRVLGDFAEWLKTTKAS